MNILDLLFIDWNFVLDVSTAYDIVAIFVGFWDKSMARFLELGAEKEDQELTLMANK